MYVVVKDDIYMYRRKRVKVLPIIIIIIIYVPYLLILKKHYVL